MDYDKLMANAQFDLMNWCMDCNTEKEIVEHDEYGEIFEEIVCPYCGE